MTRLSLRTRLTLWFSAAVLLILSPFLTAVAVTEWRSTTALLDHHLREDLEVVTELLTERNGAIAWRGNAVADGGYDAGPNRWVEVYALDGRGLFFRGFPEDPAIRASLRPPANDGAGLRSVRTPAGAFVRELSTRRKIGAADVWVRVVRTEDGVRADFRRLSLTFGLIAPLAVLIASVAGYVISGRMLSPLARMAQRARAINADRLSDRLPVGTSGDELDSLSEVFNQTFARLEGSFGRLRQFTADVSHQLRTPLTAIRSVGEVGLREPRDPAAYQEIIGSMLEESDHLARVVDTLLTLSRWESGRVQPAHAPVDLCELARDVAEQLLVLAEERGVELDMTGLSAPCRVEGDAVMLRQAVINVLDNAIKFTRPGTRVALATRVDGTDRQLIIDDAGPGIPAPERDHVLQRFYRIQGSPSTGSTGAGLGLAIVHWAVVANGGRLVLAESPSGGARVVMTFPQA